VDNRGHRRGFNRAHLLNAQTRTSPNLPINEAIQYNTTFVLYQKTPADTAATELQIQVEYYTIGSVLFKRRGGLQRQNGWRRILQMVTRPRTKPAQFCLAALCLPESFRQNPAAVNSQRSLWSTN